MPGLARALLLERLPHSSAPLQQLYLQATEAQARAVLDFLPLVRSYGRGRPESRGNYRHRIARECLLELLYHGDKPLGTHNTADTKAYVQARKKGRLEVPGLVGVDIPQWSPTTATNTARTLDRFRHHLKGNHGDRVPSVPPGSDGERAKDLATLPNTHAFLSLLDCCNSEVEIGFLWLARRLNRNRDAWGRIRPKDVSFHGPNRLTRIELHNEDGTPCGVVHLVEPGASWAWRLLKRSTIAAKREWIFCKTDGKRHYNHNDFSSMFALINDRPKARAIPREPHVKLRLNVSGLSDSYLVAALQVDMNPQLAAALRECGVSAINGWYEAVKRQRDQVADLARQGVTVHDPQMDVRPVCQSCGRDVLDGKCMRCGMPQSRADAPTNDAEIRALLESILASSTQTRRDLFDSARQQLASHWPKPEMPA